MKTGKSLFDAPLEIQSMYISGCFGNLGWDRYASIVVKYPDWFNEEDVKICENYIKEKNEKLNNLNSNSSNSTIM